MFQKFIFIATFLFSKTIVAQDSATIYYDQDWKETTKDKASYYRPMPLKEVGELVLVHDFYLNGTPQFEGYSLKNKESASVGDMIWYDEEGNDKTFRQYYNNTKNSTLTYYHANGKIRKTVQYKNGVKDGETIIYGNNGDVLMKGIYLKRKPISGDFEIIEDDYEGNSSEEPRMQVTTMLTPQSSTSGSTRKPKKNNKKTVNQKIFWANTSIPAQEKTFAIGDYSLDLIQQKNYDPTGKLVQTVTENNIGEYNSKINTGIEYSYYLQNNFATGIKSKTNFVNGEKSGKSQNYHPKGNLSSETNYREGIKEGEEITFSENGSIKEKRTYKQNDPFNGGFQEQLADLQITSTYIKGLREGEAIARTKDGEQVAKGIYKNGKPFNGTFVLEKEGFDREKELINVENFKKTGLQKVFNYSLENISKTYTLQNEKLNGTTTFYNDEKPIATLDYKDDEPFEGTLIEGNTVSLFKNGKITRETMYNDKYVEKSKDQVATEKFYENGNLTKIINRTFQISEKPQSTYEGIYKNGKPFSGFFETEYDREFKQVDFYENGEKKFQYSNNYLENMENYRLQQYDIKSIYKDGKIVDGVEYELKDRQFVSRYLKNGVLTSFDWDLFAVNYFNRIHFELKGNAIEVNDMQEKSQGSMIIDSSKNCFTKKLMINGKLIDTKTYSENKVKTATITFFSIEDGKLTSKNVETLQLQEGSVGTSEWIFKIYLTIDNKLNNVQQIFNHLSENIGNESWLDEIEGKKIITGIKIDAEGKPEDGIMITENKDKTFLLQSFEQGKMKKQTQNVSFKNLEREVEKLEQTN